MGNIFRDNAPAPAANGVQIDRKRLAQLRQKRAAFQCDCSKERVSRAISTLSKKDLDDIINDGEAIEVKCQFCNKAYHFEVDELKEMRK